MSFRLVNTTLDRETPIIIAYEPSAASQRDDVILRLNDNWIPTEVVNISDVVEPVILSTLMDRTNPASDLVTICCSGSMSFPAFKAGHRFQHRYFGGCFSSGLGGGGGPSGQGQGGSSQHQQLQGLGEPKGGETGTPTLTRRLGSIARALLWAGSRKGHGCCTT